MNPLRNIPILNITNYSSLFHNAQYLNKPVYLFKKIEFPFPRHHSEKSKETTIPFSKTLFIYFSSLIFRLFFSWVQSQDSHLNHSYFFFSEKKILLISYRIPLHVMVIPHPIMCMTMMMMTIAIPIIYIY